ncbi:hypothetical protein LWF01_01070 [Saxibacter everestensis]|uniref:Secreted protein n=1 Tax=Saxibacter everestensis TaxID=2909229 RepID=A0ABY8QVG4_9MICO|nr:hypothetical protein LWF01_01070 [Brevibacteriaceae bacterium ZFBP1038]
MKPTIQFARLLVLELSALRGYWFAYPAPICHIRDGTGTTDVQSSTSARPVATKCDKYQA